MKNSVKNYAVGHQKKLVKCHILRVFGPPRLAPHLYGLGFMDRVELFGVKKSQFKEANAMEVRKNKIHMKKLMTNYEEDLGNMD